MFRMLLVSSTSTLTPSLVNLFLEVFEWSWLKYLMSSKRPLKRWVNTSNPSPSYAPLLLLRLLLRCLHIYLLVLLLVSLWLLQPCPSNNFLCLLHHFQLALGSPVFSPTTVFRSQFRSFLPHCWRIVPKFWRRRLLLFIPFYGGVWWSAGCWSFDLAMKNFDGLMIGHLHSHGILSIGKNF